MAHKTARIAKVSWVMAALALTAGLAVASADGKTVARFTANAFDVDGANVVPLQISIERWSTAAERDRLLSVLADKGQNGLLEALQKNPKVGYIRTNTSLGWDLHFAWREKGEDGGERVVVATDRPMSVWETVNQPRTVDYPFTIIEMHLNNDGEGQGMLSYATKIIPDADGKTIVLENWGTQRIQLNQVKADRS